ncbi:synergin gamma isoform X3 [Denticeps clupeoides]|uniref:synergin gamma isoform X3 n=1 Tax=Denticeps clupeoides TaxID=299321 RepID=UPI0010A5875B|nr:synergin gamma isoform X3 [Denticeps clupeoides]
MALRPGSGGGGSFMFPVGGGLGPPQAMMAIPQQQQQQQQGFPMVPVMQPNMQGMMGMNFGGQLGPGAMPLQAAMPLGMQPAAVPFMGPPQFLGLRGPAPQYPADLQKQMAEEHQKRLEQQQRLLDEDRKRRQFEEQKQKLRLLSSVKPKMGEKSRDDALEAIKGNLDGFSRDAKMHPTPSTHTKQPDSSPLHSSSSVLSHSLTPAFPDDHDDEFSDFMQGPTDSSSSVPPFPSSSSSSTNPVNKRALHPSQTAPTLPAIHHSAVISSSQPAQGPSLEEKLLLSCDLSAAKKARVPFKSRPPAQLGPIARLSARSQASDRACDLVVDATSDPADAPPQAPGAGAGVAVFPQQDHIQPMVPAWLYNDSLVPDMFKKVLEFTMTPAGIDTAKLYPILMSSGLPREALGQIWASANRTTPGKLTKEELYTVLALIGVAQSGLPVMSLDILGQFPTPPVPNLPALTMVMPSVLPQQQQPIMAPPPVSLAMAAPTPSVMGIAPNPPPAQPPNAFIANFPPVQATKTDDDDFQDFQEAPKAGGTDDSFADFQAESGGNFPNLAAPRSSAPPMLTPVSGSSSSDKYAAFKQLSADVPAEATPTASADFGDKYSVFRELQQPADRKLAGDGFADFKSGGGDDGFTDFKTADSISPLDPPDPPKIFPPTRPAHPVSHPKNPLNMADLDLFSTLTPTDPRPAPPPSLLPRLPAGGGPAADDFGDFALFGSSSSNAEVVGGTGPSFSGSGSAAGVAQDDFADFMAFGSSGEAKGDRRSSGTAQGRPGADKYDVFKQLSLEGGLGSYDDGGGKDGGAVSGSFSSLRSDTDDFADFQSSKFCTALGASERSLVDKMSVFKHAKEDTASVKSLDLPSIGGSSVGKEDSEDALSVQLDMKLSDVGGDLKHVMSDSSLDLPGLSAHQPPAAEVDDLKFDPFGMSSMGGLTSCDWSDREDGLSDQGQRLQTAGFGSEVGVFPSSAIIHRKETLFGSSENITHTISAKVTTFSSEEAGSDDKFQALADFGSGEQSVVDDSDDFGDFASTVSEKSDSPPATTETGTEVMQGEPSDDMVTCQGDKPKFGKSDFLKASSQAKVKSSEEMIQSELATFDLSVQGSHKRSHSLGEKEMPRSSPTPSPAPEQQFRDRSNTLSDRPALPVIRDKYKDLTGEVEESERYAYEWERCLESALQVNTHTTSRTHTHHTDITVSVPPQVINTANNTLNSISSSNVCTEVIQSAQGMEYLLGVVEVYRVTRRVELAVKAIAVCSEKLQELLKDINRVWNNLIGFMSLANLTPDESSLDFSSCVLRHGIKNAKELACGVCLLNVESRSKAFNSETDNFRLTYGGHQYHASCANFWINCVEPKPPGLVLPDLL